MASDRVLISMSREDLTYIRALVALPTATSRALCAALASPDGIDPAMVEAAARAFDVGLYAQFERAHKVSAARSVLAATRDAGTDTEGEEA